MRAIAMLLNGTLIGTLGFALVESEIQSSLLFWWSVTVTFAAPAASIFALLRRSKEIPTRHADN
jgi:hypothetical protein